MTTSTETLIRWIDSHGCPAPTRDNGDGTLTVASIYTLNGEASIGYDTIPATRRAALGLLGY